MEAFKHIMVLLLTLGFGLSITGCATVKKNTRKDMLDKHVHSNHLKSKLRYKI